MSDSVEAAVERARRLHPSRPASGRCSSRVTRLGVTIECELVGHMPLSIGMLDFTRHLGRFEGRDVGWSSYQEDKG